MSLSANDDCIMDNHKDWCAEDNFGANNFVLNPTVIPTSKIRHDVGLHVQCGIAREILLFFRRFIERCDKNDPVHSHFEEPWWNTCYSNQFKNGETCSRINGTHVKLFHTNAQSLVDVIKSNCRTHNCTCYFIELLLSLPSPHIFLTKVRIESKEEFLNETDECKDDMKKFHKHGIDAMFADAVRGDGEAFHCHCAKHYAPRIASVTLDQLSCGVGFWTMQ